MKDFDNWNELKKRINNRILKEDFYFYEGEIWWCALGENIGIESNGKNEQFSRPVLIIKKFNKKHCLVIPATTKEKVGIFYFPVKIENKSAFLILSQIRVVDSKRFLKRANQIDPEKFSEIKKATIKINFQ